jgi:hypothetical protein
MNNVQSILSSRTIWANIVGLTALALPLFGYDGAAVDAPQSVEAVSQIVAGLSFLASTFFRVKATKKLI